MIDAIIPADRGTNADILRIRKFRQDENMPLTFRATLLNPYKNGDQKIAIYVDDKGYEYWVDTTDHYLVQVGPGAHLDREAVTVRPESRLAIAELRRRAIALATSEMPEFTTMRAELHPLEDSKNRQIYFFRWDDFRKPVKEVELPPFIQVGIYADGALASFTNTLVDTSPEDLAKIAREKHEDDVDQVWEYIGDVEVRLTEIKRKLKDILKK